MKKEEGTFQKEYQAILDEINSRHLKSESNEEENEQND